MQTTRNTSGDPGYLKLCTELKKTVDLQFNNQYTNRISNQAYNCLNNAKKILKQGVPVNNNSQDDSDTPLHYAVKIGDTELVNMLLLKGANVNAKNERFETPLHLAIKKNSKYMINLLLNQLAEHDLNNSTALQAAISSGNKEIFELLLEKGFNVNTVSEIYGTPLHCAIRKRSEIFIKLLLDHNADVNAKDNIGMPALHYAISGRVSANIINNLLQKGADINAKDDEGMTPLNHAVIRENSELVHFLLDKNPDCNDKNNKLAFCLSFVRDMEFNGISEFFEKGGYKYYDNFKSCLEEFKKYKSVATIFVDRGFTVRFEDLNDMHVPETLYHLVGDQVCIREDNFNLRDILNKEETSDRENFDKLFLVYKILNGSVQRGFTKIVHNLLTPAVNVNATLATGLTLLHYAVIYGQLEVVEKLLSHGADVNAVHKTNKMSALHLSVLNNHYRITSILLKNNAFTEAHDEFERTPLLLAVQKQNCRSSLMLLDMGANWNTVDVKGNTSLDVALDNENLDIAEMLLYYGASFNKKNQRVSNDSSYSRRNKEFIIKHTAFKGINLDLPEDRKMLDNFQIECREEIVRMKLTRIGESNISIYDLLIKSRRQIAMYMRNEDIVQVLDSMDFEKTFPIYECKLRIHVMNGKITNHILKLGYQCLGDALKLEMPDVIIHKICSYLENADLCRLISASPIDDEEKESIEYKDERGLDEYCYYDSDELLYSYYDSEDDDDYW